MNATKTETWSNGKKRKTTPPPEPELPGHVRARRDAARIAERILAGERMHAVAEEYGCASSHIHKVYASIVPAAQRKAAALAKSQRTAAAPEKEERAPIGTVRYRTRLGKNRQRGVPYVKVRNDGPKSRRWIPLTVHVWEQAHGPVPDGKIVCPRDGDSTNADLANLELRHVGTFGGRIPDEIVTAVRAAQGIDPRPPAPEPTAARQVVDNPRPRLTPKERGRQNVRLFVTEILGLPANGLPGRAEP